MYGRAAAEHFQNLANSVGEWAIDRAAAGALVAAAPEIFSDTGYIEFAFAAQAHAIAAIESFAEESRDLYFAYGKHVVDEAFAVFFSCAPTLHLFLRNPSPAHVSFGVEVAQGFSEQSHLGNRVGEINTARAMGRIGASQD